MATLSAALAAKTVGHEGVSKGGCPPFGAGFEGAQPLATFGVKKTALGAFWGPVTALAMPTNGSAPPQTHRVSGRGRNVSGEGVKQAVSRRVWPPRRRGDSGTTNIAAPKDSTTRAAKDRPVWFHCSAPAVRYEGKCDADSAHANHSENGWSMKGLSYVQGKLSTGLESTTSITSYLLVSNAKTPPSEPMVPKQQPSWLFQEIVFGFCSYGRQFLIVIILTGQRSFTWALPYQQHI